MSNHSTVSVTFANAETMELSRTAYYNPRSPFQKRVQPETFVAVGRYHLVVGYRDLAVSVDEEPARPQEQPWVRGWVSRGQQRDLRDTRLNRSLPVIEAALSRFPSHPCAEALRKAISTERTGWARAFRARTHKNGVEVRI